MNPFKKFSQIINWQNPYDWDDVLIKEHDKKENSIINNDTEFYAIFRKTRLPKFKDLYAFTNLIEEKNRELEEKNRELEEINRKPTLFSCKIIFDFEIEQNYFNDNELLEYLNGIMKIISKNIDFFNNKEIIRAGDSRFKIIFSDKKDFNFLNQHQKKIKEMIKYFGLIHLDVDFILEEKQLLEDKLDLDLNAISKSIEHESIQTNKWKKTRISNFEFIELKFIRSHKNPNVQFDARIYKINPIKTKSGGIVLKIHLNNHDYTEAISVSKFLRKNQSHNFKVGDLVNVKAQIKDPVSRFKFNVDLDLHDITKIKTSKFFPDEEIDNAKIKRVEISARTWKTTMDGISSANQYVEHALRNGYSAIGIADLDSVQAFPEFYNAVKATKIKPIYGSTFSVYHSKIEKVINFNGENHNLKTAKFVILDLETTGLSAYYNEIIEFGAIVFQNGIEIEKHQFFIKPSKNIPEVITKITGITQKMIDENGVSQETAIKKIDNIIKNGVLVAHNATFDFSFLQQFFKKHLKKTLKNSIIDTLEVSRFLSPNEKSHSLKNIAKRLEIQYDDEIAHRADYDAKILTSIWINFLNLLGKQNVYDLETLSNIKSSIFELRPEKVFPKQLTIIAKNQRGIKKLYKLVSLANTENLISRPLIFYDRLEKDPDLLVGSGGPESLLIQTLLYFGPEKVSSFSQIFDFIEIPPPIAFIHLVKREIFSQEQIEDVIQKLIALARELKIPAVAIGDVRYCLPKEKIFYELYIYAKAVGGINHVLFDTREKEREDFKNSHIFPEKHFFTTDELKKQFEFLENSELIDEIVVKNSNIIANLIVPDIQIIKAGLYPPTFDKSETKLKEFVYEKAYEKYGNYLPELIDKRIKNELEPIINHGFHVVYWISKRIVQEAKAQGAIVDSRGSVGSSFVAFLIGITDVNPLLAHYLCNNCHKVEFSESEQFLSGFDLPDKNCENCNYRMDKDGHNIPFETFLGFNAEKVPDIDLNFSGETQLKMHDFVRDLFGIDKTFRAGTILTNAEKTVFGLARKLGEFRARLDPKFDINHEVSYFTNSFLDFLATKAQGVKRTSGKHAGGIIVIPQNQEIEDFTPINFPANNEKSDWKTTHFDYNALHDNLLKLDILGHDDPTILLHLEELTKIKSDQIPKSDPKILSLFSSCKELGIKPQQILGEITGTIGIPEFGTPFVRKMLQSANVKSFADIFAICGLAHGTGVWQDNAQALITSKKHLIHDVISCRDDIMIYLLKKNVEHRKAFNIMENVRKGKGLDESDIKLLMGQKVPIWYIESLQKIGYLFPKAHAVAYAMKAWKIAYFKLYHPLAFYSSYFSIRPDVKDIDTLIQPAIKIAQKINLLNSKKLSTQKGLQQLSPKEKDLIPFLEISLELKARGFEIEKVNLEKSDSQKWIVNKENNSLIPPFIAVDGIGDINARKIVQARNLRPFSSIEDFEFRTETNKTSMKKLKELGVFDNISKKAQVNLFE
ncbi:PolC-type DNA polymerase III [Mesomycoplasma flocculare]|uniref:PolC-type DNA polymerase III n=1 Tax=Mesomycoplasma flocculare TaxID=2128 RepID=UPI00136D5372|nr:PolC-type DNA polymerase III [Mesomycoplasma flocculare]MXR05747.1 PolC-type DNA polymerase III [Mesomycoplasma flocculare]MXR39333.1 PolC-type DNA polymerase III [Mycoplasma sp. MF12]